MNKFFLLILTILIINIYGQPKTHKEANNQNIDNSQKNNTSVPPPGQHNNTIINQTNLNDQKNGTDMPKDKEFNLTESLIKFFKEMLESNKTNDTEAQAKKLEEEKKMEQKRIEEQKKREKMEKIRMEAEKAQKEKERQKRLQLEKEREEFEKQIENITVSEFTNLYLEGKSGELLYHNITKPCNLKIIFLLTDTEKTIHLTFNGPNTRGGASLIKAFRSRNFLYYVHNAQQIGQYTFYLNNYHNSDETEVIFAISDDSKADDRLGKKNIDKITGYLNDIDSKINQMKSKQNIINKKTNTHNESVNKHNREILIYSIIEVVTMFLVFLIQTCYIKNIVEKL